jgi:hypothetical protein
MRYENFEAHIHGLGGTPVAHQCTKRISAYQGLRSMELILVVGTVHRNSSLKCIIINLYLVIVPPYYCIAIGDYTVG